MQNLIYNSEEAPVVSTPEANTSASTVTQDAWPTANTSTSSNMQALEIQKGNTSSWLTK